MLGSPSGNVVNLKYAAGGVIGDHAHFQPDHVDATLPETVPIFVG